ncbi:MAG: hypothetical protein ACLQME_16560 [Alphaproteobacteria bacterium]
MEGIACAAERVHHLDQEGQARPGLFRAFQRALEAHRRQSRPQGGDRDIVYWTSVTDSGDPALLQAYLDQFPQGTFAGAAKIMIEKLNRSQAAALPMPSTSAACSE